jgi:hypothetical protein
MRPIGHVALSGFDAAAIPAVEVVQQLEQALREPGVCPECGFAF